MDIGKSFTYVFEDPNWIKKVLIGGGILFVGLIFSWLIGIPLLIAGAMVLGYSLTVTKNVADGSPTPLPEWAEMGTLFMKGLYGIIGALIYFLPVIALSCCLGIFTGIAGSATGSAGQNGGSSLGGIIGIVSLCLNCLISILSLVAGLTLYAPLTRFAMSANQLSIFWDFRGNLDFITKNLSSYIIALVIALVASVIGSLGLILCFVGYPFTIFWAYLVGSHVFGQLWRHQGQAAAPAMA
jgi:hypothetical protein